MSTTTAGNPPARPSGVDHGATGGDLGRLVVRALRREGRRLDALFINLALPVGIMVVFVYVFGGAIATGSSGLSYIDFVVPAVLLLSAGYGAALTAGNVAEDMNGGIIDRLRTLPISSWVVPTSHVIASVVRNVVTAGLALAAAVALGFRPDAMALDWALVLALVSGYVLAISAMAVVWGWPSTRPRPPRPSASSCCSCPTSPTASSRRRPCPVCFAASPSTSPSPHWLRPREHSCSISPSATRDGSRPPGSPRPWWSASRPPPCSSADERPRERPERLQRRCRVRDRSDPKG
jgi:ABC-2 type transporter